MGELREKLADLAHQQWAGWMKYLFSQCYLHADGTMTIPAELVARWNRQLNTLYEDLPEEEKESDRVEADRMLALMNRERGSGRIKEFGEKLEPGHR
jgi:hypothetical protein